MARGINKIQLVLLAVGGSIGNGDSLALDGDAPLPLYVHGVQNLVLELTVVDNLGLLDEAVGKGGFSVVDVGHDTKISLVR